MMFRFRFLSLPLLVGLLALLLGATIGTIHGESTQRAVDAAVPPPTPVVHVVVRTRTVIRLVPHNVIRVHTITHVRTVTRVVIQTHVVVHTHVVTRLVTKTVKVMVPVYHTRVVTNTVIKTIQLAAPTAIPVPTDTPAPPQPTDTPNASSTSADSSNAANNPPNTYNGVTVSASNLQQDSNGDMAPASGNSYTTVHVSLTNNGSSNVTYNPLDFTVQGATDNIQYKALATDTNITNSALGTGSLVPGQTVAGDLAFETPTAEMTYTLLWTPDIMSPAIPITIK